MGCDIHVYVERKVGYLWQQVKSEDYNWGIIRHYNLFGLLAGVRGAFDPLVKQRGLPKNLSDDVKNIWGDGEGYHTPSFFSLFELLDMRNKIQPCTCYLNISDYKSYKKSGLLPDFWSEITKPYKLVSNDEMTRVMNLSAFLDETEYFTKVINNKTYKEISPEFFVDFINMMQKLSEDPKKIRCVFWFDN